MKTNAKKLLCISLAAAMAMPLAACSTEQSESAFDNPLPWHATAAAYEKLDYSVAIYNTEKSEKESERVKIADGTLTFTLTENAEGEYTELKTDFNVKYNNTELAGADAGLTDKINSRLVFQPNGLTAKTMEKTVTLADRTNQKNLSYKITADYFGTHKATLEYFKQDGAKVKTRSLSRNAMRDNEIMFFAARAQALSKSSSTNFKMVNIFDSFNNGETAEYTMIVTGTSERKVDLGDWVKDFGIEAKEVEGSEPIYPVTCINTSIAISGENAGPAYYVLYAKDSFKQGEAEHKKIPVKINYSSYKSGNPYRHTEYTLTGCSFTKQA